MDLKESLQKVKKASLQFVMADEEVITNVLLKLSDLLIENTEKIIQENKKDLELMEEGEPLRDRVMLDEGRIAAIAAGVKEIAAYKSPVDVILEEKTLANGLQLKKTTVPFGVVGAIFEARPNVLIDTFALCFKSRNACVMKGGSQAANSNAILFQLILQAIDEEREKNDFEIDNAYMSDLVLLLSNERELMGEFLKMADYVDVIITRGSQSLIDFVRENSLIPVIETGRGVCHTFVDETGKLEMARDILFNAKTQRPSVCNSLDTLIIHSKRLNDLAEVCKPLLEKEVAIYADYEAYNSLKGNYPNQLLLQANEENFGMEYLSLKMSIKTVDGLMEAIEHINTFGSRHSEAIITETPEHAKIFLKAVDAACVYVNASTRFTDGGEFGLGAEVGISTQKLHARGPMGIKELTTYKWAIWGEGQVR